MTQLYELLYLVPTKISEEELPNITGKVKNLIRTQGAEIKQDELWGKRKLSYPIKQFRHVYYWLIRYQASPEANKKINQEIRLISEIIRFMIIKAKTVELASERPAGEKVSPPPAKAIKEPVLTPHPSTTPLSKESKKVSLEELDRKLDELLDQNIT